ncbi:ANTAR domain-containing protein [Amycolatopsis sp. NBC_01488]|uniref:ANTAR domain-containing protein n=1 Tax=Amycolatopsis sp. NBC_01488 TaxID=2903563 RepID=UPI002E2C4B3E|nr:ANTAR domain-containing protein [Amycolatopsis sp. NBC_01488]
MFTLIRGWSADEAFTTLREISQRTNVKLHDVATVVVAAGSRAEPARRRDRPSRPARSTASSPQTTVRLTSGAPNNSHIQTAAVACSRSYALP